MYKKYIAFLLLFQAAVLVTFLNVKGIELNRIIAAPAFRLTLEQMQEKFGKDIASVVADPGFEDAAGRDFSLKKDSKAVALGFVPIDIRDCGAAGTGA